MDPDNFVKHTKLQIPLGHSRYGGSVIDMPKGLKHPKGLRFAAQLDLGKISTFDPTGLLPKTGHLYFFADIIKDKGKAFYYDTPTQLLTRQLFEHQDNFFLGVLISDAVTASENWMERFRAPRGEWEQNNLKHLLNNKGVFWDAFAGADKSKMFGIFTHCQRSQNEVGQITFSDRVVLLQIGENGFNDVGIFSVLIPREALRNRNFKNCEFHWSQS